MPKHVNPCYACPCVTVLVGVWQDLLVSILASCSGVMVVLGGCWGISINLWATMGNHGRHVTWSWKWTLMVIFWYVCLALVAALIFKLRGLTSMLPHTSSKTAAFAWRQCRGLLNMRMHVQSFSLLLCLEGIFSIISGVGGCWRFCLLHRGPEGGTVTRYGYCSTCHIPRLPWCFPKAWDEMMKGNMSEPWWNLMNDCMTTDSRIGLSSINRT